MKVRRITPAGRADVYNVEVEGTHCFAVNGGIIVHNCFDETRYLCQMNPITPPVRAPKSPAPYDPLSTDKPASRYDWMTY